MSSRRNMKLEMSNKFIQSCITINNHRHPLGLWLMMSLPLAKSVDQNSSTSIETVPTFRPFENDVVNMIPFLLTIHDGYCNGMIYTWLTHDSFMKPYHSITTLIHRASWARNQNKSSSLSKLVSTLALASKSCDLNDSAWTQFASVQTNQVETNYREE